MKKRLSVGLLLAFTLAHANAGTPGQALASFYDALATGNKTAAMAVLADDVLIFESGHVERSKNQYVESHLADDMDFAKTTHRSLIRQTEKGTAGFAIIESETETSGTYQGKKVHFFGTETAVLTQSGERWLLQHVHWSSRVSK